MCQALGGLQIHLSCTTIHVLLPILDITSLRPLVGSFRNFASTSLVFKSIAILHKSSNNCNGPKHILSITYQHGCHQEVARVNLPRTTRRDQKHHLSQGAGARHYCYRPHRSTTAASIAASEQPDTTRSYSNVLQRESLQLGDLHIQR